MSCGKNCRKFHFAKYKSICVNWCTWFKDKRTDYIIQLSKTPKKKKDVNSITTKIEFYSYSCILGRRFFVFFLFYMNIMRFAFSFGYYSTPWGFVLLLVGGLFWFWILIFLSLSYHFIFVPLVGWLVRIVLNFTVFSKEKKTVTLQKVKFVFLNEILELKLDLMLRCIWRIRFYFVRYL